MKLLRLKFIFWTVFYLVISVSALFAQEPHGKINGSVADSRGPVSGVTVVLKLKNSYYQPNTYFTDDNGNFTAFGLRLGTYEIFTKSDCRSAKTEDIQIVSEKPFNLNIKLADEDCQKKVAEEAAEWQMCEQEVSVQGLEPVGFDQAEISNQILEDSMKYENGFYTYRGETLILSTENIRPDWISSFQNIKINLLSPQQIQAKAEKDENGVISYLAFHKWRLSASCAFAGLSVNHAVGKNAEIWMCGNKPYITYLYHKENGKWKKTQQKSSF